MLKRLLPSHSASTNDLLGSQPHQPARRLSADFTSVRSRDGYSTPSLSPQPTSANGYIPPVTPYQESSNPDRTLSRQQLQRSLHGLEEVLTALDEFRHLCETLHKSRRKLAKSLRDVATSLKESMPKTMHDRDVIVNSLISSGNMIESFADTDQKFGKTVQKQYDVANDSCAKAFKKIARDERDHDEILGTLDMKLKRASANYEKRMRATHSPINAASEHEKHIALISALSTEMHVLKAQHGVKMRQKRDVLVQDISKAAVVLAENEFRRGCEGIRKAGAAAGPLASWSCLVMTDASQPIMIMPEDLPDTPSLKQSSEAYSNQSSPEQAMYSDARVNLTPSLSETNIQTYTSARDHAWVSSSPVDHSAHSATPSINSSTSTFAPADASRKSSPSFQSRPVVSCQSSRAPSPDQDLGNERSPTISDSTNSHSTAPSSVLQESIPETAGTRYASLPPGAVYSKPHMNGPTSSSSAMEFVIEEEDEISPPRKGVERTLSIESTDSSRSFVARMKERYLEEKAKNNINVSAPNGSPEQKQYSENTSRSHQSRPSLPVVPSSASITRVLEQNHQSPPRMTNRQVSSGSIVSEARMRFESVRTTSPPQHSDACGCEKCSKAKYGQSTRAARRVSMPSF